MEQVTPHSNFVYLGELHYKKAPSSLEKPESIDFPAPAEIQNETEAKWKFYHLINRVTQFLAGTRIGGYLPFIRSVHHLFSKVNQFKKASFEDYRSMQGRTTLLGSDQANNECVEQFKELKKLNRALFNSEKIQVWVSNSQKSDSLQAANAFVFSREDFSDLDFQKKRAKIVTVNYANAVHPGGAALRGGRGSQEEALFRSTLLCASIDPEKNPALSRQIERAQLTAHRHIPYFGGIYSPDVPATSGVAVFAEAHNFLSISACDLRSRQEFIGPLGRHQNPEQALYNNLDGTINWEKVEYRTKEMLRTSLASMIMTNVFQVLEKHSLGNMITDSNRQYIEQFRIDTINLGALGCGAFENDPKRMAQWIVEVLQEATFRGVFAKWIIPQGTGAAGYNQQDYYNGDELLDFEEVKRRGLPLEPYNREAFVWAVKKSVVQN